MGSVAEEENFDVMVFTETKMKKKETRKIPGYNHEYLNRDTDAGGVVIYTKNDIKSTLIKKNQACETIWVKITDESKDTLVIGGTYSPCESSVSKAKINDFVNELDKDV